MQIGDKVLIKQRRLTNTIMMNTASILWGQTATNEPISEEIQTPGIITEVDRHSFVVKYDEPQEGCEYRAFPHDAIPRIVQILKIVNWKDLTPEQRNACIAEKVMEWSPNTPCDLETSDMELTVYDDGNAFCPRCHEHEHINSLHHGTIPPPPYSTDIKAAWFIVDFLKGQYTIQVTALPEWYSVEFFEPPTGYRLLHIATAKAPAEAICIAALRAKGFEVVTE